MSTITVKSGATIGTTGGTDVVYTLVQSGNDDYFYQVLTDTDLRLRRSMRVKVKRPQPSTAAPNGYTQGRVIVTCYEPILLANGKITVNTKQDSFAFDVEASAAVKTRLLDASSQMAGVAALAAVYNNLLGTVN